jgi:hypothetical protein
LAGRASGARAVQRDHLEPTAVHPRERSVAGQVGGHGQFRCQEIAAGMSALAADACPRHQQRPVTTGTASTHIRPDLAKLPTSASTTASAATSLSTSSHHIMKHPDGRTVSVPVHVGVDMRKGTLRNILAIIGMTVDELRALL